MTGITWIVSAASIFNTLVSAAVLGLGAALLMRSETRAGALLWGAAAITLIRDFVGSVINAVFLPELEPDKAIAVALGFQTVMDVLSWLLIAGAFVLVARALREPRRAPTTPGTSPT